jgi:hypothetical protein
MWVDLDGVFDAIAVARFGTVAVARFGAVAVARLLAGASVCGLRAMGVDMVDGVPEEDCARRASQLVAVNGGW